MCQLIKHVDSKYKIVTDFFLVKMNKFCGSLSITWNMVFIYPLIWHLDVLFIHMWITYDIVQNKNSWQQNRRVN